MNTSGGLAWFAAHEARLAWREWLSLMTAGRKRRVTTLVLGLALFAVFLHGMAYLILLPYPDLAGAPTPQKLVNISVILLLALSLMLSQAIESVTRAFYARADLDLLLSSPASAVRLFAVRVAAMAVTIVLMSLGLAAPFINVLAWRAGARWLGAYGVAVALALLAVALAIGVTVGLFRTIGPRRTRVISQIVAAVIGAGFLIGLQLFAIMSFGSISRLALLQSGALLHFAPDPQSALWLPARAVLGDELALAATLGAALALLGVATYLFTPRFGPFALAAIGSSPRAAQGGRSSRSFHRATPAQALRRKEWVLLLRDPWLVSQTLMQLLYLLPPAFLLWRSFYGGGGAASLLVPVLVMAAGQTGGGLAWLAISGEDAPELIASAPIPTARVLRAKTEAVMTGLAVVFAPLCLALAFAAPLAALVAMLGIAAAAASATAIQFWFRTQAKRSHFRRRQTSSRVATFAEALASISWAGTGALAASGTGLALVPGCLSIAIVAGTWLISPARN